MSKDKKQSIECSICARHITKYMRNLITCLYCHESFCKDCYKNYFLTKSTTHCMNTDCKKIFTQEFLYENFPKTWVNGVLIEHQSNIIFEQQKSLLPETAQEIYKMNLRKKIPQLQYDVDLLEIQVRKYKSRAAVMVNGISETLEKMLQQASTEYENKMKELIDLTEQCNDKTLIKSSQPCLHSNCKGYCKYDMNQEIFSCMVCQSTFCALCYEIKTQQHVCDKEKIKTMALMKKDSKHCPNCKELINKVSGCDQMFCLFCKCCFSWETGEIDKGRIHNPHYFEWQERNRRNPQTQTQNQPEQQQEQDAQCLTNHQLMNRFLTIVSNYPNSTQKHLNKLFQLMNHIYEVEMTNLNRNRNREQGEDKYHDYRLRFIQNKISDVDFKKTIQSEELIERKKLSKYFVLDMVYNVLHDLFVQIVTTRLIPDDILQQITQILTYHNTQQQKVSYLFSENYCIFIEMDYPYKIKKFKTCKDERFDININQIDLNTIKLDEQEQLFYQLIQEETQLIENKNWNELFFPVSQQRKDQINFILNGQEVLLSREKKHQRCYLILQLNKKLVKLRKQLYTIDDTFYHNNLKWKVSTLSVCHPYMFILSEFDYKTIDFRSNALILDLEANQARHLIELTNDENQHMLNKINMTLQVIPIIKEYYWDEQNYFPNGFRHTLYTNLKHAKTKNIVPQFVIKQIQHSPVGYSLLGHYNSLI